MAAVNFQVELSVSEKGRKAPQYRVDTDQNGELTLEGLLRYLQTSLVSVAGAVLKEEQARGFDKSPIIVTDNRKGKPASQVNPFGKIEIFSRVQSLDVIKEIYDAILLRSPVDTGLYKSSNVVLFNGEVVANTSEGLTAWLNSSPDIKERDTIRFLNATPYARKLERYGITAQKGRTRYVSSSDRKQRSGRFIGDSKNKSVLAPNGAYFLAFRSVRRKFKNNFRLSFGFLPGQYAGLDRIGLRDPRSGKPLRRSYVRTGQSYLYPTIVLEIVAGGSIE